MRNSDIKVLHATRGDITARCVIDTEKQCITLPQGLPAGDVHVTYPAAFGDARERELITQVAKDGRYLTGAQMDTRTEREKILTMDRLAFCIQVALGKTGEV